MTKPMREFAGFEFSVGGKNSVRVEHGGFRSLVSRHLHGPCPSIGLSVFCRFLTIASLLLSILERLFRRLLKAVRLENGILKFLSR